MVCKVDYAVYAKATMCSQPSFTVRPGSADLRLETTLDGAELLSSRPAGARLAPGAPLQRFSAAINILWQSASIHSQHCSPIFSRKNGAYLAGCRDLRGGCRRLRSPTQ